MQFSSTERILLVAPTGSDAIHTHKLLTRHQFESTICSDVESLCKEALTGVGAILIAEEALEKQAVVLLKRFLENQRSWSDIPLVVITSGGDTTIASFRASSILGSAANVVLVERPFRTITLLSTLRSALRSRVRQYQVRELLEGLEAKVAERTARLEETVSELEAFSYSVSHDLRAPLRAIQGYSFVLMEDYSARLDDAGKGYVNRIMAASNRLDRLVQDILTYSRASRNDIEFHRVDLDALIREIIEESPRFRAPDAEVLVRSPIHPVCGHEASLTQCISNLLGNAVKFVPVKKMPRVTIWSEPIASQIRIFFQDNGIGIERAYQAKIFKMFERLVPEDKYEGTGIGLAIVQKAVERMGGKVGVDSIPGEGSTFWIQLPAA